jgi:Histone acetyltransferase
MTRHYIIPIFVPHKGCPHDCVFCNQKHITGHSEEIDSTFVENEIDKYLKTFKNPDRYVEVSFFGGSFTGLPINEQVELLKPAKKALNCGKVNSIRLSTRPDYINRSILDNLKEYGVSVIELGVQSMDEEVLSLSNRGHSSEDVYKSSELIKEYGFTLGLQMMVGLPGDNEQKDIFTAKEFVRIGPDMVRIYPALVVKDTYMEIMYNKGSYRPLDVDEAVDICSRLYLIFERHDIKIIRIGLQPTENMQAGRDVIAGPFHPAFRELVESKILNDMIGYMCRNYNIDMPTVYINPMSVSKLYSNSKKYFNALIGRNFTKGIKIIQDINLPLNSIKVMDDKNSLFMSIKDYSLIY